MILMIRINNLVYLVVRERARKRIQFAINLTHMREKDVLKASCNKQRDPHAKGKAKICCV